MAKIFTQNGYDALGWNCRSCGGELNRLLRFYHHGDAGDLRLVIDHALKMGYEEIVLVGFSMGGSLSLRAVAEFPDAVPCAGKKSDCIFCSLRSDEQREILYHNRITNFITNVSSASWAKRSGPKKKYSLARSVPKVMKPLRISMISITGILRRFMVLQMQRIFMRVQV
jgi:predicted alpha/beta-fold hydrolase